MPAWSPLNAAGPSPPGDFHQAVAWDAGHRRLFLVHRGDYSNTGDVWRFDLLPTPAWSFVTNGPPPDGYFGRAAAYDDARDQLLVAASYQVQVLPASGPPVWSASPTLIVGDAFLVDRAGDALISLAGQGSAVLSPLAGGVASNLVLGDYTQPNRGDMGAAFDSRRRRAIVQGGWDQTRWFTFSSTAALDVAAPSTWTNIGPVSGSQRLFHQMAVDPERDRIVSYGGIYDAYEVDSLLERPLSDPDQGTAVLHAADGPKPTGNFGMSSIADPPRDRVLFYGGIPYSSSTPLDELWSLSSSNPPVWSQLFPSGDGPGPLAWHSMLYDRPRDRFLILGGYGNATLHGVWELTTSPELHWRQLATAGGEDGSSVAEAYLDESIGGGWAWGGYSADPYSGRIWRMSIGADTIRFAEVPQVNSPEMWWRAHPCGFDPARQRIVAFGEDGAERPDMSGFWSVDLGSTATWTWKSAGGPRPYNRYLDGYAFDAAHDRLVIFGGYDDNEHYFDDWWSLNWDRATPTLASLMNAEVRDGRAQLQWQLSGFSGAPVGVQRAVASDAWVTIAARSPDGAGRVEFDEPVTGSGTRVGYRLLVREDGADSPVGEAWLEVPAGAAFALGGATRNPVMDDLDVAFSLDRASRVSLALYDISGRRVVTRELNAGAGAHRERLAARGELAAGVYFVRLADGVRALTARAVVVR
jgi:hypothetical protein